MARKKTKYDGVKLMTVNNKKYIETSIENVPVDERFFFKLVFFFLFFVSLL